MKSSQNRYHMFVLPFGATAGKESLAHFSRVYDACKSGVCHTPLQRNVAWPEPVDGRLSDRTNEHDVRAITKSRSSGYVANYISPLREKFVTYVKTRDEDIAF